MNAIPFVIENTSRGPQGFDIFSRMLRDRIIFLTGPIDEDGAASMCAQLLFLEAESRDKDISIYINSPGGSLSATLAIYDTMQFIRPEIRTVCVGMAASGASVVLMAGTKGKRFALPNAEVMVHQPHGGMYGQVTDLDIEAKHVMRLRTRLYETYCKHTGKTPEEVTMALERNCYLNAQEALDFGLIDAVVEKRQSEDE